MGICVYTYVYMCAYIYNLCICIYRYKYRILKENTKKGIVFLELSLLYFLLIIIMDLLQPLPNLNHCKIPKPHLHQMQIQLTYQPQEL